MSELRKSSGAFDLPSILTGVIVVGILAAGVLAAIFGVIPFAQDHGAKQDLSSIRTAEGAARAKDNRFMDHAGLLDVGYLHLSSTKTTKVMSDEKGTCYFSIAKSGSGKVFYATDRNPDPEILTPDTEAYCLSTAQLAELIDGVGGIEEGEYTPAPTPVPTPTADPVAACENDFVNPGFEQRDEGWTTKYLPGFYGAGHTGSWSLSMDDYREAISQTVMVPAEKTKFTFWYKWQNKKATSTDVYINGERFAYSRGPEYGANDWMKYTVDLSAYAGKCTEIGFGGGTLFDGILIDDVALEQITVPDPPATETASSREGSATVNWASTLTGGIPTTSYTATAWLDGKAADSVDVAADQRTATLTGVEVGSTYTFTVTANNALGKSAAAQGAFVVPVHDGAFANPGFEQHYEGWTVDSPGILRSSGRTDTTSFSFSEEQQGLHQRVMVPAGKTNLTFWYKQSGYGYVIFTVNGVKYYIWNPTNTWTQHTVDLSAYAGQYTDIGLGGGTIYERVYIDDVALEPAG